MVGGGGAEAADAGGARLVKVLHGLRGKYKN